MYFSGDIIISQYDLNSWEYKRINMSMNKLVEFFTHLINEDIKALENQILQGGSYLDQKGIINCEEDQQD